MVEQSGTKGGAFREASWSFPGHMVELSGKPGQSDECSAYDRDVEASTSPSVRLPGLEQLVLTQGHTLLKSRQPMSLTQKRLLSLGIAIQRRADIDLRRPRIYTNDFARLFGLSGNSIHKTIADASKGLLDLKVFIDLGEGSFRGYNWVTEAAYIGQRRSEVNLQAVTAQAASANESGWSADAAAKVIAEAVTARKPRTRYTVGYDAALIGFLRILPDRIVDRILAAALRPHFPKKS